MNFSYNETTTILTGDVLLGGELVVPSGAKAIIIFSDTGYHNTPGERNHFATRYLHQNNLGTFVVELLTVSEEKLIRQKDYTLLLTSRLIAVTKWLCSHIAAKDCSIGYFAVDRGAAAALNASVSQSAVEALVLCGGYADLTAENLSKIKAPVLMIVGSYDYDVLRLNHIAFKQMTCERELEMIHGASHFFEEEGAMEKVCELTAAWFKEYLHAAIMFHR